MADSVEGESSDPWNLVAKLETCVVYKKRRVRRWVTSVEDDCGNYSKHRRLTIVNTSLADCLVDGNVQGLTSNAQEEAKSPLKRGDGSKINALWTAQHIPVNHTRELIDCVYKRAMTS